VRAQLVEDHRNSFDEELLFPFPPGNGANLRRHGVGVVFEENPVVALSQQKHALIPASATLFAVQRDLSPCQMKPISPE
jgi:hypothetical protein